MTTESTIKRITERELNIYSRLSSLIVKANYRFSYPDYVLEKYPEYIV